MCDLKECTAMQKNELRKSKERNASENNNKTNNSLKSENTIYHNKHVIFTCIIRTPIFFYTLCARII